MWNYIIIQIDISMFSRPCVTLVWIWCGFLHKIPIPMRMFIVSITLLMLLKIVCVNISVIAVQQRFSSHGYSSDIGPPASFNQLPQPEGDWTENYDKKQRKYNSILAASAVFFAATIGYVSTPSFVRRQLLLLCFYRLIFNWTDQWINFNANNFFFISISVEANRSDLLQCLSTGHLWINVRIINSPNISRTCIQRVRNSNKWTEKWWKKKRNKPISMKALCTCH